MLGQIGTSYFHVQFLIDWPFLTQVLIGWIFITQNLIGWSILAQNLIDRPNLALWPKF